MDISILDTLKPTQMVHLATCEGSEPRVRPMTLIARGRELFLATGASDNKSAQLEANPNAEFCLFLREEAVSGYLRGRGLLLREDAARIKKEVADFAPFIYNYWSDPADPGYRLYRLELRQLRYLKPGEMLEEVLEL